MRSLVSPDRKYYYLSISQPPVEIVHDDPDDMQIVIRCPYCGHKTTVGDTVMISGFIGCPHCYWEAGGLLNTVMWIREHDYEEYKKGDFYKAGFKENLKLWKERKKHDS